MIFPHWINFPWAGVYHIIPTFLCQTERNVATVLLLQGSYTWSPWTSEQEDPHVQFVHGAQPKILWPENFPDSSLIKSPLLGLIYYDIIQHNKERQNSPFIPAAPLVWQRLTKGILMCFLEKAYIQNKDFEHNIGAIRAREISIFTKVDE